MKSTFSRRQFAAFGAAESARYGPEAEGYWLFHRTRLWDSYKRAAELLPEHGRFVSVGAGPAYVETALARTHDAQGAVVDFRETLEAYESAYATAGLKSYAVDLTTAPDLVSAIGSGFDLALSLEVVEHLPIAPSDHIAPIAQVLRAGGSLLLSTPNAGNLRSVLKTFLHRPTLPPAEQTFATVGYDHQGVHRREYMRREIVEAFRSCGLTVTGTGWTSYGRHGGNDLVLLPIEWLVPPFRLAMTITGTRPSAGDGSRH